MISSLNVVCVIRALGTSDIEFLATQVSEMDGFRENLGESGNIVDE